MGHIDNLKISEKYGSPEQVASIADKIREKRQKRQGFKGEKLQAHVPVKPSKPREGMPEGTLKEFKNMVVALVEYKAQKKFYIREENKSILDGICRWFMNDDTGIFDLKRGFYIKGLVGTGKSDVIKACQEVAVWMSKNRRNDVKLVGYVDWLLMLDKIEEKKDLGIMKRVCSQEMIYDDFVHKGRFSVKVNYKEHNVIEKVIRATYLSKSYSNIFISNHSLENIKENYDVAVYGRILQMCQVVHWAGTTNELRGEKKKKLPRRKDSKQKNDQLID